jgi:hypothetical protein
MEKTCSLCKQSLPVDVFVKNAGMKSGLGSYCRPCACKKSECYRRRLRVEGKPVNPMDDCPDCDGRKKTSAARCKPCRDRALVNEASPKWTGGVRSSALRSRYSLTIDDYEEMHTAQGGVCALCTGRQTMVDRKTGAPRALAVDHDHQTGAVRGLLCGQCNVGLGMFKDNPDLLEKAAGYLRNSSRLSGRRAETA